MRLRLPSIVRTFKNDISRSFRFQIGVCPQADLSYGTVFAEEIVQVGTGDVEVATGASVGLYRCVCVWLKHGWRWGGVMPGEKGSMGVGGGMASLQKPPG